MPQDNFMRSNTNYDATREISFQGYSNSSQNLNSLARKSTKNPYLD